MCTLAFIIILIRYNAITSYTRVWVFLNMLILKCIKKANDLSKNFYQCCIHPYPHQVQLQNLQKPHPHNGRCHYERRTYLLLNPTKIHHEKRKRFV